MDAAVLGDALAEDLRAHLVNCEACAMAFAAEQQLYATVNQAVSASIGEHVPASLLPRVRAEISDVRASSAELHWRSLLISATALLALLGLVVASRFLPQSQESAKPVTLASAKASNPERKAEANSGPSLLPQEPPVRKHVSRMNREPVTFPALEQVRVEPGARVAMAGLIRLSQDWPATVKKFPNPDLDAPVVIKPIEMTELTLAPIPGEEQNSEKK
jgi:anti-sigma factor RsiW